MIKIQTKEELKQEIEALPIPPKQITFFKAIFDKDNAITDIKILYFEFIDLLISFGFKRFDIGKDSIYIKIENNVVEEVTLKQIQDFFIRWLNDQPDVINSIPKKFVIDKIYKNPAHYFSDNRLSLLMSDKELKFVKDTKDKSYFFFKNGFVEVTKWGWILFDYKELHAHIWKNQIIERNFTHIGKSDLLNNPCVFSQFLYNTSIVKSISKEEVNDRFNVLKTLIGYNLHNFFDGRLKATILTDSKISENPEGRTGKSLLGKAIAKLRNVSELNGKVFDLNNRYKYQQCHLDTQIIVLNDVLRGFNFELLFNDITEKVTIEKKNQHPFDIQSKILISTNEAMRINGGSAKARCFEFELGDYYDADHTPDKEFKHWFFTDWDKEQFNQFDNFMLSCCSLYLEMGVIEPKAVNLDARKLLNETSPEFLEFMEEKDYQPNVRYPKDEIHNDLLNMYTDFKEHRVFKQQRNTTRWLRAYVKYSKHFTELEEINSNGKKFVIFKNATKVAEDKELEAFLN